MNWQEPKSFIQGETLKWKRSFDDYDVGEWTLKYYFRGAGTGFDITATADGKDFSMSVSIATTAACSVGRYDWQAWMENEDGVKYMVDAGTLEVKKGFASIAAEGTHDGRSEAEIALANIRAMLAGKANLDQQSYVIGNRQLNRIPIPDLLALESRYVQLVSRERQAARLKKGGNFFKTVLVRMKDD